MYGIRESLGAMVFAASCLGQEIAPASGEAHKRRCLEALALC